MTEKEIKKEFASWLKDYLSHDLSRRKETRVTMKNYQELIFAWTFVLQEHMKYWEENEYPNLRYKLKNDEGPENSKRK